MNYELRNVCNSEVINHSIEPQILDISVVAGIAHMKKCKKHKPCSWRQIFLWNLLWVSYEENCCKNKIIYFNHSHNYLGFIFSFVLLSPITLFCEIWRLCVSQINYDLYINIYIYIYIYIIYIYIYSVAGCRDKISFMFATNVPYYLQVFGSTAKYCFQKNNIVY